MDKIKGTGVALITPFNEDLSIDYVGLENLLNHVIDGGVNFLVLMGTTGESSVLSKSERNDVITFCKRINNSRLPLVLGVGGNNTLELRKEIKVTNFEGIDAVLSVSPAYNKPTQEGIYQHYKMISQVCPLPIILYNVPGRTASNITVETTLRLAHDFNNIVAIKEASGDLDQIMKIIKNKPNGFMVLSGDDGLTLPMIHMGAEGVISVIGQSHPKKYSKMVKLGLKGEKERANALHYKLYDFYGPLYAEGNPAGVKSCLEILGICKGVVRPPLVRVSDEIKTQLIALLN
ncbi:4-hydroxy-tetrahydrodipicolinate synthase [Flavobacteriales bacterium]|nr:4-hydroxy-tetrahydrodipicolinate synthase [Flavobacteriales bacterium]